MSEVIGRFSFRLAGRGLRVLVFTSVLCFAQLHAQSQAACQLISLADISATFGREMFLRPTRPQLPENCSFSSVAPFDNPKGPTVNLQVRWSHATAPDPDAMVDEARTLLQQRQVTTTTVAGIGDAAFWFGNEVTGELWVFRGGRDTLVLAGQLSLDKLKALALKALGGAGRTGFAYTGTDTLNKPGPTAVAAAEPPLVGGASFSQAIYLTQAEFLKQVKEVSLSLSASPELVRFVSAAELRNDVAKALAARGIAVRAGAPVALRATFEEVDAAGITTTTGSSGTTTERFPVHNVYVALDFYVRAVVMRNGQAHLLTVAPARSSQGEQYVEDNELRKMLFGNQTVGDMKELVVWLLDDSLDRLSSNYAVDATPWYASGWTAAQKSVADAEFLRLLNSGQRAETTSTAGIDTAPQLELSQPATDDPEEACPAPNSWQDAWNTELKQSHWTRSVAPPSLTLRHSFYCRHIPIFRFAPGYYRLTDEVSLREANAAFVLNGRVFRKPVTLVSTHHMSVSEGDTLAAAIQKFIPESVNGFSSEGKLGSDGVPAIPATPVQIVAGTASPDNAGARAALFHPDAWERQWDVPFYPVSKYTPDLARKGRLILEGTVARLSLDGNYPQWLRIYFKEAPDNAVTLCTPSADIFDGFGAGYKGLVGRTVEAAGDIDGLCTPKGGIRILQSNQVRTLSTEKAVP